MLINNRRILYAGVALVFSAVAIVACLFIGRYANTALDSEIKFSHESGFYDEPLDVELSIGSNYFITYTLDGRVPDIASARYEGPIHIADFSDNENNWSMIRETSLRYFEKGKYDVPNYKIDKCAVLRVAAFDYAGNQVDSEEREYFIGFQDKTGYKDMYNLCVISDPDDLFSVDNGIYSAGTYYADRIQTGEIQDMFHNGFWDNGGSENYYWSGRLSERPAVIELFSPEGELLTREACGVRVRGGESRRNTQKPLGFYAREEYSGHDYFTYDIFGDGSAGPRDFLIHNAGDDFDVKLMDYVIYTALSKGDFSFEISPTVPCNLFLDGEYWGPMYLMKDLNCDTIGYNYNLSADNIVLIKSGEAKLNGERFDIQETELEAWNDLLAFVQNNDMSDDANYEYVCSQIDIENFAEYVTAEIYIANADWHIHNNSAFWRTLKNENHNAYSDRKWRCCLFDVNWAFESEETMTAEHYRDWDLWDMVSDLCQNDEFRKLYLDDMARLEVLFAEDTIESIIDEWSSVMEEPIRCHFKRFTINGNPDEEIAKEKKQIIDFCANRPEEMKKVNEWFFDGEK